LVFHSYFEKRKKFKPGKSEKLSAQNVGNENEAYPNSTMKQMTQYVSPIPTFQVNDMYLNSQDEIHSFPNIQKPMGGQSNSIRSIDEFNLELSGDEFDFCEDASETLDEPIIRRQKAATVIESSDDDNDEMYYSLTIGMFRLNLGMLIRLEFKNLPLHRRFLARHNFQDHLYQTNYLILLVILIMFFYWKS
jgi:hypothetical protein